MTKDTAGTEAAKLVTADEVRAAETRTKAVGANYSELEQKLLALLGESTELENLPYVIKFALDQHDVQDVYSAVTKGFESKLAEMKMSRETLLSELTVKVENGTMSSGERTARISNSDRAIRLFISRSGGILQ